MVCKGGGAQKNLAFEIIWGAVGIMHYEVIGVLHVQLCIIKLYSSELVANIGDLGRVVVPCSVVRVNGRLNCVTHLQLTAKQWVPRGAKTMREHP